MQHGFRYAVFASVLRLGDHPARPPMARDLGAFLRGRGYAPLEGATARLSWRDVGASEDSEKELAIGMRDLTP